MKILITGINGLVGNSLYKLLQNSDHRLFFSSRNLGGLANYKVDISNIGEVDSFFTSQKPDYWSENIYFCFFFKFQY